MTFYDEMTGVEMGGEQWMLSVLTLVGLLIVCHNVLIDKLRKSELDK